ncbi:MAG: YihY/virulence factor BrkB family protein [Gammaproteobacteria bacterium]
MTGEVTTGKIWSLVKKSIGSWSHDHASSMGGALAYYTLLSIAPILVIVIAVAGFFLGDEAARREIMAQVRGMLGDDGAAAVQGLLKRASEPTQGLIATISGIALLIIGATTVFAELQADLDRIWRAPATTIGGLWALLRARLLSFGMILAMGFLLLVSLVVSSALAALGKWWGGWFEGWALLLEALNFTVSFAVTTTLFAVMYKMLPRADIAWRDVWIGAVVTAALFTVGKLLIGLYMGRRGVASGFGAAGSFTVLLFWVYYSAQSFFLGAEFTWVYANEVGSRAGKSREKPAPPKPRDRHPART